MMQLAILHYHLNRGGVARVVENHLLALAKAEVQPAQVVVLHGGRADGWPQERLARELPFPLRTVAVSGLDYDSLREDTPSLPAREPDVLLLANRIVDTLTHARFDRTQTLLHWHNHALGKNVTVPPVVAELARRGYRLLLQIHDFAEDLRPENYRHLAEALTPGKLDHLPDLLYPQSKAIHYAVLNGRDRQLLGTAGVADVRLHLLPNPVSNPAGPDVEQRPITEAYRPPADSVEIRQHLAARLDMPVDATWITYPVRGIRRKNLGEMLLWSVAASAPASGPVWLHVTISPNNPVEHASFGRWQRLANQLNLPCRFGSPAGGQESYEHLLAACDLLLTTSVAEGFGMVFLECWLAGRQLLGRDLPEITTDFRQAGIRLEPLTPELAIPTAWIDRGRLVHSLDMLYYELLACYGQQPPTTTTGASPFAPLVEGPTIDFARLPSQMQEDVIRHTHFDSEAQAQLRALNRQLDLAGIHFLDSQVTQRIDSNRKVVEQAYSLATVGGQLGAIYAQLLETEPSSHIDSLPNGRSLLESLLHANRLYPIRIEP